jgi:hypothetical protein
MQYILQMMMMMLLTSIVLLFLGGNANGRRIAPEPRSITRHSNNYREIRRNSVIAATAARNQNQPTSKISPSSFRKWNNHCSQHHHLAFAFSPSELWAIRIASAGLTYFGFVAVTDRPRGRLKVPEAMLQIKESMVPGAGMGLYLTRDLPGGTVLGEYPGVVLPLAQHAASRKMQQAPLSEAYIWRFSDNQYIIDPTDEQGILQDFCRGGNPSTPLSVGMFATVLSFVTVPSALCRINEPPKGRDVNVITEEDLLARKVTFCLERDCYAGEELFIDYGLSYDRSCYGGAE